jgi:hypothetical protein
MTGELCGHKTENGFNVIPNFTRGYRNICFHRMIDDSPIDLPECMMFMQNHAWVITPLSPQAQVQLDERLQRFRNEGLDPGTLDTVMDEEGAEVRFATPPMPSTPPDSDNDSWGEDDPGTPFGQAPQTPDAAWWVDPDPYPNDAWATLPTDEYDPPTPDPAPPSPPESPPGPEQETEEERFDREADEAYSYYKENREEFE